MRAVSPSRFPLALYAAPSYLSSRGVNQQRMIVTGAGETRPIASNDTEAGRAQNRRVEITLVPIQQ